MFDDGSDDDGVFDAPPPTSGTSAPLAAAPGTGYDAPPAAPGFDDGVNYNPTPIGSTAPPAAPSMPPSSYGNDYGDDDGGGGGNEFGNDEFGGAPPSSAGGGAAAGGDENLSDAELAAKLQAQFDEEDRQNAASATSASGGGGGGGQGGGDFARSNSGGSIGSSSSTPTSSNVPLGSPPQWVNDEDCDRCMASECGIEFDWVIRRHHCRYCGKIFCDDCSNFNAMLPPTFGVKEPQRVCQPCYARLMPLQEALIKSNTNSQRTNELEEDGMMRYLNSPIRFTLGGEVRKAAYTMQNLIDGFETALDDGHLSEDLLRDAEALMFMTVTKAAFVWGVRFGTGLVIRRLQGAPNGQRWSAPCAILMAGLTMGAQIGAEVTDMVVPLHESDAVEHFSVPGGSHLMLGSETGLAFGPLGRSGEASVLASARGMDATMSYSHSRGLFAGMSVEGAYVTVRDDVNMKYYGSEINPAKLFDGSVAPPINAKPLYDKLNEYEQLYNIADSIYRNNPQDTPPPAASDEFADDVPAGDNGGDEGGEQGGEGAKVFSPDRRQAYQAAAAEYRNEHPEEQWGGLYEAEGGVAIGGDDDTANDSLQRYQGGSRWKCDENTTNSLAIFPERHAASNIESSRVATGKKAPIKNPFEDLDNDGDGDVIV